MNGLLASRAFLCRSNVLSALGRRSASWQVNKLSLFKTKTVPIVSACNQKLMSSETHSHTKLWTIERIVSAGLLAIIPGSIIINNPIMDYALALALVLHIHWGLEAIVVDYIRPKLFGPVVPKLSLGLLYLLSILSLGGLFYLNYTDVGIQLSLIVSLFLLVLTIASLPRQITKHLNPRIQDYDPKQKK